MALSLNKSRIMPANNFSVIMGLLGNDFQGLPGMRRLNPTAAAPDPAFFPYGQQFIFTNQHLGKHELVADLLYLAQRY